MVCDAESVAQTLLATLFTWAMTALGATDDVPPPVKLELPVLDAALAFPASVLIAASLWSPLTLSIAMAEEWDRQMGAAVDRLLLGAAASGWPTGCSHLHLSHRTRPRKASAQRGVARRCSARDTLHNIRGPRVGVAFGAVGAGSRPRHSAAPCLAIGIGLQNCPEGTAVSVPCAAKVCRR